MQLILLLFFNFNFKLILLFYIRDCTFLILNISAFLCQWFLYLILMIKISFFSLTSHPLDSGSNKSCSEYRRVFLPWNVHRHSLRDKEFSPKKLLLRRRVLDASLVLSCSAATSSKTSLWSKISWSHALPTVEKGPYSVRVSAASVAQWLLQYAALTLRLLLQGDVLDLGRVARSLCRHPRDFHRRSPRRGCLIDRYSSSLICRQFIQTYFVLFLNSSILTILEFYSIDLSFLYYFYIIQVVELL